MNNELRKIIISYARKQDKDIGESSMIVCGEWGWLVAGSVFIPYTKLKAREVKL